MPTYVFSSGHGDVIAQAMLLEGLGDGPSSPGGGPGGSGGGYPYSQGGAPRALPQNLRIISNFYRTAPDGSVRPYGPPRLSHASLSLSHASLSRRFVLVRVGRFGPSPRPWCTSATR